MDDTLSSNSKRQRSPNQPQDVRPNANIKNSKINRPFRQTPTFERKDDKSVSTLDGSQVLNSD